MAGGDVGAFGGLVFWGGADTHRNCPLKKRNRNQELKEKKEADNHPAAG